MKNTFIHWATENAPIFLGSFVGGWIQIYFIKKKGSVVLTWFLVIMNLFMALFVGYWAAHAATAFGKPEWAVFIASWSAIASNSILNLYNNNKTMIWKQIVGRRFNLKDDDETNK